MGWEPDLTIITPIYWADEKSVKKLANIIKSQKYKGKVTHIFLNDNVKNVLKIKGLKIIQYKEYLGLTTKLRKGMQMAKTEIVVSLVDDCLPSSNDWLKKLVAPLESEDVVATSSKVELPKWFWDKFDFWSKALTAKEQTVLTTALDQKGCAYKKGGLEKVDYVDDKNFKTGGDDADLYIKMKKIGKIVSTDAKVYHLHDTDIKRRIKKEMQYAEIAVGSMKKNYFNFPLKWKVVFVLPLLVFVLWVSSIFISKAFFVFMSVILFLLANRGYPLQVRRLWKDWRILLLPFFNLFIYFAWIYAFASMLVKGVRP